MPPSPSGWHTADCFAGTRGTDRLSRAHSLLPRSIAVSRTKLTTMIAIERGLRRPSCSRFMMRSVAQFIGAPRTEARGAPAALTHRLTGEHLPGGFGHVEAEAIVVRNVADVRQGAKRDLDAAGALHIG